MAIRRFVLISQRPFGATSTRFVSAVPVSCLRAAISNSRGRAFAPIYLQAWPGLRKLSTSAAGQKESAQATEQAGRAGATDEQPTEDESYYAEEEPLAAKISRSIWLGMQMCLGLGILSIVGYAGYTIVTALLPGGASANAVMRKASNVLRADPELVMYFGDNMTVYGQDFGGRAEGRRYFVPDFSYVDKWDGQEYHRVRFSLEGSAGRKALVWAEVRKGTGDFRYIIVLNRDKSRVWSVLDNRKPEPTLSERQGRLSTILSDYQWAFFADNDIDVKAQRTVFEDYWDKVVCVRCDREPARCADAGVTSLPAWSDATAKLQVPALRGVKQIEDLETLAHLEEGRRKSYFSSWFPGSSK